jgi:hypothetical protein
MTSEEQARIKQQMSEGHLSTDDVGRIAQLAGVKTVILSHLTWKADDDYSTWADEVKKRFSGPVLIAKDLKEFDRLNERLWLEAAAVPLDVCFAGFHECWPRVTRLRHGREREPAG